VRNLLLLRGDDPSAGDQPDAKPVFDLDSRSLTETARAIRDGKLPHGTKVGGAAPFFIGAADIPIDPPPGWEPDGLKAKVAAGARFVQTQFCMDTAIVRRYAARLADAGLSAFLLIGVNPLRSARSAAWMRRHLFGTIIPDAMVARLEQAEDAAAEVFLKLYRVLHQKDETLPFRPWVSRVAGRHCIDKLRKRKREQSSSLEETDAECIPDRSIPSPLSQLLRKDEHRQFREQLTRLPERYKAPLILLYYKRMSYSEVARVLNTRLPVLRTMMFRAKGYLRRNLQAEQCGQN